jgi:tRNA modification GTPase
MGGAMDNERVNIQSGQATSDEETIAAIATPVGQAGIGIIRISGPLAFTIAEKIFTPHKPVRQFESHRLYLGRLRDPSSGASIDEVLLSFLRAPHSYTRENVVEINSHSGYLLLFTILDIVLNQGARLAKPGEFTFRAFLNGRIDLTQAEAVMQLIDAQSDRGLHLASQQVQGSFRQEIEDLRKRVVDILARVEAAIDFPDEEIEVIPRDDAVAQLEAEVIRPVKALIEAHEAKKIWVDGIQTAIVGRVNAGKSSLLNRLSNEMKAIVTSVPGTTRDVISSTVSIHGVPFRLMDTAGFRKVRDEVERIGVNLAEQKLAEADFLFIVIDQSRGIDPYDLDIISKARGKNALIVINKTDLPNRLGDESSFEGFPTVRISALTGEGLDDLKKTAVDLNLKGETDLAGSNVVPNLRHKHALAGAAGFFQAAISCLEEDAPKELVAEELKNGLNALGEIIGETTTEDILDSIFSQFCLGK